MNGMTEEKFAQLGYFDGETSPGTRTARKIVNEETETVIDVSGYDFVNNDSNWGFPNAEGPFLVTLYRYADTALQLIVSAANDSSDAAEILPAMLHTVEAYAEQLNKG